MVAAIAAFSESLAIGMYATRSQAATSSTGRPSRSAPTSSVTGPSAGPRSGWAGGLGSGTSAMRSGGSSAIDPARASATWKIAPMLARTALGDHGSAQRGPSATLEAPNAWAARSTAPTLPGSESACRYTHNGPCGRGLQRCS